MLTDLLKDIAPGLATMVAGPLGGAAVKAIASKLGVEDTVEAVTHAIQNDPDAALKLREIDLKEIEAANKDRDSARDREAAIATSDAAPIINKVVTPVLALGVTTLTFGLFAMLIFVEVKPEAKDILIYILGALSAALTQILSYYFGSSAGSKEKDDKIKGLLK
jgi:energy-converting hydrogenase Eha subunit A